MCGKNNCFIVLKRPYALSVFNFGFDQDFAFLLLSKRGRAIRDGDVSVFIFCSRVRRHRGNWGVYSSYRLSMECKVIAPGERELPYV